MDFRSAGDDMPEQLTFEPITSHCPGIIERRQDVGPDPAAISSLIAGIGGQFGAKGLPTLLKAFKGLQV